MGQVQKKLIDDQKEIAHELREFQEFTKVLSKGKLRAEEEYETLSKEIGNLKQYQALQRDQLYDVLERTRPEDHMPLGSSSTRSHNILKVLNIKDENDFYNQRDGPASRRRDSDEQNGSFKKSDGYKSRQIKDLIYDISDILDQ